MSPPAVKPYVEGQTGSLSDVIERGPELAPFTPAGPGGFAPKPSWTDLFHAARPEALRSTPGYDEAKLGEGYKPIVDLLGLPASENPGYFSSLDSQSEARFGSMGSPSRLATAARAGVQVPFSDQYLADRTVQESLIVDQIKARRAKDPNWGPGIPDTVDGLHSYFEQQQAAKRAAGGAVLARGSTFGRVTASLAAGGVESAVHDPTFLPTMVLGGGTASSLLQAVGRDALINGVLTAAQLPQQALNMAENDEHLTVGEAVSQVAAAAAIGAAAGGAVHLGRLGVERAPPALFKVMPESVQARWAGRMKVGEGETAPLLKDVLGDMDNRELSTFARSTIGARMTPDENAAANVLERSQELGDASPFQPGPEGDAAHNASLAASLKSIIDGAPGESPKADLLASSSPIGLRPPRPVAMPVDAGFEGQWRAIVGNEGGTGAHGEFLVSPKGAVGPAQIMPGTAPYAAKLAGLPWDEAKYRGDPAYNQELGRAYYAEQLKTFGDPAMAAAAYNAGPGSAARGTGLRGALAKAAEHGEPENWEAYLPRETQRYVEDFRRRSGGVRGEREGIAGGGEDPAIAELRQSADQAESDGLELARGRAAEEPVPLLKRELFAGDEQWADAQAAFHQSLNAPEEAAGAPLSSETPSGPAELAAEEPPRAAGAPAALPAAADRASKSRIVSQLDDADHPGSAELGIATSHGDIFWSAATGKMTVLERGGLARELDDPDGSIFERHVAREDPSIVPPLSKAELEAMHPEYGQVGAKRDPLWLAAHNFADNLERGQKPGAIWALRDKESGEVTTWSVNKRATERERAKQWEPGAFDVELLHPNNVALELRDRAVDQAGHAAAADVRLDEPELTLFDQPGGAGARDQVASLEHDARMEAAEQLSAEQMLERNRQRPRQTGLKGEAAKPIATFVQDPARIRAKGQRKRDYYLTVTQHADHKAAKAGDWPAAERLVDDLVRPEDLERAARDLAGARFVPVIAEEAGGRNTIPLTLAERYADAAGGTVDTSIVQSVRAFHTGASPAERIVRRARFDGPVIPGERYVLVDDVAAMGGSVAELADHIQSGGGKVERVVLLASGVDDFAPTPKQIRAIHDGGYAEHFRHFAGIEPEALTRSEAEWALGRSSQRVRDQLAEAVGRRRAGGAAAAARGEEGQGGLAGGGVAEAPRTYQLDESGNPKTLAEILDEIDRDKAAAAALRSCAEGGGE